MSDYFNSETIKIVDDILNLKLESDPKYQCVYCDGTGYINFDDKSIECRHCEGTGKIMLTIEQKQLDQMLKDLEIYGSCATCKHCDKDKYPGYNYCEFGGCNGGGNGKIKENRWEYRYSNE